MCSCSEIHSCYYLSVCVERREGSVQHAAPHLSVPVVQSVRHKEEEERRHLGFVQVLGQLVQSQSDATPDKEECVTKWLSAQKRRFKMLWFLILCYNRISFSDIASKV